MRVLVVGTYESGHQPLHVASAAAALRRSGHHVSVADLSVGSMDPSLLAGTGALAVAVPMSTAIGSQSGDSTVPSAGQLMLSGVHELTLNVPSPATRFTTM